MVKFTVSTNDEKLLSLHGCKKQKKTPNRDKISLESNFEKCVSNLVNMKYRLPFVFSCERFENALICIISRFRPILNFSIFRKNGTSLELLNIVMVFENSLSKGPFGEIKKKNRIFWTAWRRILDSYRQRLLNMNRSHRFCFSPFFLSILYPALCSCTIGSFLPCV